MIAAEQRQECLCDDQDTDQIDFELMPEILCRKVHQRSWHCNPSIADQPKQGFSIELLAHFLCSGLNSDFIGNIKEQGNEILPKFFGKPFSILCFSYAPKDTKSLLDQDFCDAPANPR